MDPSHAEQIAVRLMADHGLIARGWSFSMNRRKRSLGLCNFTNKRIELSVFFVRMNDPDAVKDTIRHEIAHALAGERAGHGSRWVAICKRLGAVPKSTCSTAAMPLGAFRSQCPGCGKEHDRHRRPKRGCRYHCRACGPRHGKLRFVRETIPIENGALVSENR